MCSLLNSIWGGEPTDAKKQPNIVFIVVDTLRADHVGCYGYGRQTTPTIDKVAVEGIRFEQVISSSSWTLPSVMSTFTSLPASLHGAEHYRAMLYPGIATLAEILKKQGYQTAGITSNPTTNAKYGFGKGFDFYDDYTIPMAIEENLFDDFKNASDITQKPTSKLVNKAAFKWLEKKRKGKFFLFLVYLDPHADYLAPKPFATMFDPSYKGTVNGKGIKYLKSDGLKKADREHLKARYDGEVRFVDENIKKLLQKLTELKLDENTLLILMSDHGEEFWEHGGTHHGHSLYDELIKVPLIMKYPKFLPAGKAVKQQISNLDIMPTILDLLGIPIPKQCQGQSLLPLVTGKAKYTPRPVYSETKAKKTIHSLRTPTHKLIVNVNTKKMEAYNLEKDPKEQNNLIDQDLAWKKKLIQDYENLQKFIESKKTNAAAAKKPELDEKTILRLKAMGYLH